MQWNNNSFNAGSSSFSSSGQGSSRNRATGIIRQRAPRNNSDDDLFHETNPRTDELIAKFMVTNGLPFDVIHDRTFKQLLHHLNPSIVFPQPKILETNIERLGNPTKPIVNFAKSVGPLTVTVDIAGSGEEKFLCFSIHFFEDFSDRKNAVYLRRMMLSELDMDTILTTIRRAVSTYSYSNVRFTNIVCPDQVLSSLLCASDAVKRGFICFEDYMSAFVMEVLDIKEFADGLQQLRTFVQYMRKQPDLYSKFRREQLTRNAELDLPLVGDGSWDQTTVFLTRCLILHEAFNQFVDRWKVKNYISNLKFDELIFLQRVLQQCVKYSRELSVAASSISQVVPAIMSMRNFLATHTQGYPFEKSIREAFTKHFQPITNGPMSIRYDLASILDPRFAYREHIYSSTVWSNIEKNLIEEFITTDPNCERSFNFDIGTISTEDRRSMILPELKKYRATLNKDRPLELQNPFVWWGKYHGDMEILVIMAREYLACPAVTVSSKFYFSDGGKLKHLCKFNNHQVLENSLTVAGANQIFRGRGACPDNIQPHLIELLNGTVFRRQEDRNRGINPDRGNQGEYPPLPTIEHGPSGLLRYEDEDHLMTPPVREEQKVVEPIHETKPAVEPTPLEENKPEASLHMAVEEKPQVQEQPPVQEEVKEEEPDNGYAAALVPKTSPSSSAPTSSTSSAMPSVRIISTAPKPTYTPNPGAPHMPKIVYTQQKPKIIGTSKPIPIMVNPHTRYTLPPNTGTSKPFGGIRPHPVMGVPPQPLIGRIIGSQSGSHPLVGRALVGKQLQPVAGKPIPPHRVIAAQNAAAAAAAAAQAHIHQATRAAVTQNIQKHNFTQKFAQKQTFVNKFTQPKVPGSDLKEPKEEEPESKFKAPFIHQYLLEGPGAKQGPIGQYSDVEEDHYNGSIYSAMLKSRPIPVSDKIYVPRKQCNRRCCVCSHLEEHNNLKNVTVESEKIVVVLAAIYRKELSISEARNIVERMTKTYMCRVHFLEACDEILKILQVNRPAAIAVAKLDLVNNVVITVNSISARDMTSTLLRQMLINFTEKYYLEQPPNFVADKPLIFDGVRDTEMNDFDDQDIIPKSHRQPRKQVLEADMHDSTVKVIEQEDFRLPQADPSENTDDCDNPEDCCFCLVHADRSTMLRVPKSEDRLARWLHKLGPEFAERIKMDGENYICRAHFPEEAFSSRGRLLKGQLPIAMPKKVETSYKLDVQTGDFMKLGQRKSGTQKNSSINLATIAGTMPSSPVRFDSSADDESLNNATFARSRDLPKHGKRKSKKWEDDDDYEYDFNMTDSDSDTAEDEPGPSTSTITRRLTRSMSRSMDKSQSRSMTPVNVRNKQACAATKPPAPKKAKKTPVADETKSSKKTAKQDAHQNSTTDKTAPTSKAPKMPLRETSNEMIASKEENESKSTSRTRSKTASSKTSAGLPNVPKEEELDAPLVLIAPKEEPQPVKRSARLSLKK